MKLFRVPTRIVALAFGIAVVASCDSRVTAPICSGAACGTDTGTPADGKDVVPPVVTVLLAATPKDTLYLGNPLIVNTTSTDAAAAASPGGIVQVVSSVTNAGVTTTVDSTTMSATPSVSRSFTLPSASLAKGDRVTITTTATDIGSNITSSTTQAVVADTATPKVVISSNVVTAKAGNINGQDSVDVQVTAADSAGIATTGFRLRYVRSVTDTVTVFSQPVTPPGKSLIYKTSLFFIISDTLPVTGQYLIEGLAVDRSGLSVVVPGFVSFTLHDAAAPTVDVTNPIAGGHVAAGDSILVKVHLTDNSGVASVTMEGFTQRGDPNFGNQVTVVRYPLIRAPASGNFPVTRDTVITRYLKVASPVDSTNDTLSIRVIATDAANNATTQIVKITVTNGPRVTIIKPAVPDSMTAGNTLRIIVNAASTAGVSFVGFDLTDSGWPTSIAGRYETTLVSASGNVTWTKDIPIPLNAPPKGLLTIAPIAADVNGQPGAGASFTIAVRAGAPPAPLVTQRVPTRAEIRDTIVVTASGTSLTKVGYVIKTVTGVAVDSGTVPASASSFGPQGVGFSIPSKWQGTKMVVYTYATDASGLTGYSVANGVSIPQTTNSAAVRDTMLIVYGQTFTLPRDGIASDVTVDVLRGNVFVSNTVFNRLELWKGATATFDPTGIAVGSLPWGMALQKDNDTLLVANSGGTNISKVCINTVVCGGRIGEVLSQRLKTRNTFLYTVTQILIPGTVDHFHLTDIGPISYSDRPQYVAQSDGGRVFFSTRPTDFAPAGTIRWLDPKLPVPDPRQIYQYAAPSGDQNTWAVFNADSVLIVPANQTVANGVDSVWVFDHVYSDTSLVPHSCTNRAHQVVIGTICSSGTDVSVVAPNVAAQGGDVIAVNNLDVGSLNLTDSTFVSASGDKTWVGFGEGNTHGGVGRVMLVNDVAGTPEPGFFSPGVAVRDLLENASEPVFGMGLDLHGAAAVVHGSQSYFTSLESPFHLRLQGKFDSFDQGAGVAFHPSADSRNFSASLTDSTRTAFVASSNGSIEIVDAAYYIARGTLQIKNNLYGPIRASLPFPTDNVGVPTTDPNYIIVKLFGLTSKGMVMINLRAQDIQPVP
jgi:hypothetical protein